MSEQHTHEVLDCNIEFIAISDHAPITLSVELGKESFFKYQRLVSILSDEGMIKELKQSLREYFQLNDNVKITPSVLWEAGKAVLRGKMTEITSRLKKARLEQQRELDSKIKELESEHKRTSKKFILLELKEFGQKPDEL